MGMTSSETTFNDEELITYLRFQGLDKDIAAADRIEQLQAKLKASEEIGRAFEEDAGQLRAKLAKAVEVLRELKEDVGNLGDNICYCQEAVDRDLHITAYRIGEDARAVLEELEKPE